MRRCPCRPGTVWRCVCLALLLSLAHLVGVTLLPRSLLMLRNLFGNGRQHDQCSHHSAIAGVVTMYHGGRNAKPELDCNNMLVQHSFNSTSGGRADVASTVPERCFCDAEHGWPATVAGSWTVPVPCVDTDISASAPMRSRHCGIDKFGKAEWDAEHPPQTKACGVAARSQRDDVRILLVSKNHKKRLRVDGCTPFRRPDVGSAGSNLSSGLPNGAQCFLEPVSSLNYLPVEAFDAAVYNAPLLPTLPAYLTDGGTTPTLAPLHADSVVGVMSLEPSSYYPLASQACRHQHEVALDLRPSLRSSVPLPYFSWALHPLNLPVANASPGGGGGGGGATAAAASPLRQRATHHRIRYPKDKVPGALPPPLVPGKRSSTSVVWIASNCGGMNWRRQLVSALRRHMPIDSIGRCDNNAPWPQHFCSDLHEQLQSPLQPSAQQPRCDDSKGEALRRYRFYLAFENTNEEGYVTEKVYDALDAGIVPIYFGAPDANLVVPENSIVDAAVLAPESYDAIHRSGGATAHITELARVLADRILAMDRDPVEYAKLQSWRTQFPTRESCDADVRCMGRMAFVAESSDCRLCGAVYGTTRLAATNQSGIPRVVWNSKTQQLEVDRGSGGA